MCRTRPCQETRGTSEIESICQVKYAYFRLLDLKRFTELGALLTEDATTATSPASCARAGVRPSWRSSRSRSGTPAS